MRTQFLTLAVAGLFSANLFAQQAGAFSGKWTGTLRSAEGRSFPVEMQLDGTTGNWRIARASRDNPCMNKDIPLTVTNQTGQEVVFALNGSKVLAGCSDATISLKLFDDKTLEGEADNGMKVRLTRN